MVERDGGVRHQTTRSGVDHTTRIGRWSAMDLVKRGHVTHRNASFPAC
jgi:hypothetical protein